MFFNSSFRLNFFFAIIEMILQNNVEKAISNQIETVNQHYRKNKQCAELFRV
ncbi:conserved hypothetical protein [delta proteobacterium NaphS2]|nr:conserved hypothetical protein [delta proteobacterium NaphS2]